MSNIQVYSSRRKACDKCKQHKKRCDGGHPCLRCLHTQKTCTYPEGALPIQHKNNNAPAAREPYIFEDETGQHFRKDLVRLPGVVPGGDRPLANNSIYRIYLQIYFQEIHPTGLFYQPIDIHAYERPNSKPHQLQYYAMMATVMRVLEPTGDGFRCYEHRARQAAANLIDNFSVETMLGFQLLAHHYWGEDLQKCDHYRDITHSLGRRIFKNYKQLTPSQLDMLVRIQLVTVGMTDLIEYNIDEDLRDVLDEMEQALSHVREREFADTTNIEQVLEWLYFRIGLANCAQGAAVSNDEEVASPFRQDPQEFARLKRMEGIIQTFLAKLPNPSVRKSFELMMYSFMEFVGGQKAVAISCIREAIALFSAQELRAVSSPYLYTLLHSAVRIAVSQGELELAQQINAVQHKMGVVLPASLSLTSRDRDLLRRHFTLAQEKGCPPRPNGKRPLFASTDFLWEAPTPWLKDGWQAKGDQASTLAGPSAGDPAFPVSKRARLDDTPLDPSPEFVDVAGSSPSPSPQHSSRYAGENSPADEFSDYLTSLFDELPLSPHLDF